MALALSYGNAMSRTPNCQIENAKFLTTSVGEEELCERFMMRLSETIGNQRNLSELNVVLEVTTGNGIHANLTRRSDSQTAVIPVTSVEVMDRDLRLSDLDDLADTVGQSLLQSQT